MDKTVLSNRIATLQTLGSQEGKELVLSMTLSDGNNVKYLIKLPKAEAPAKDGSPKQAVAKETVSSWEIEKLGIALSIGDNTLPLGIALKITN